MGSMVPKKQLKWTERACLKLIEAIMKVEKEIINGLKPPIIKPSTGRPMGKWERISNLLPLELQGRAQPFSKYRCRATFDNILKVYKTRKDGKVRINSSKRLLTEAVYELMIKRDEQLQNANLPTGREPSLKTSRPSNKVRGRSIDGMSQQPTSGRFLNTRTNQGLCFRGRSRSTTKASRPVSRPDLVSAKLRHHNKPASPARSSPSKSGGVDSEDHPGDFEDPSAARSRTETQERELSSTIRPPSQKSMPEGGGISSMSNIRYDERKEEEFLLEGRLRRRLDLELSHLSSWIERLSNPVGEKVASDMASHVASSEKKRSLDLGKRRKLHLGTTASGPLVDDLIYESLSKGLDLGIRASFQDLRARLAEEVKNTSIGLGREVQHSTDDLYDETAIDSSFQMV